MFPRAPKFSQVGALLFPRASADALVVHFTAMAKLHEPSFDLLFTSAHLLSSLYMLSL